MIIMTNLISSFAPDWISAPGETILDILEERKWSQAEFAIRLNYTPKHVNLLIKGNAPIIEDTALKLERVLGSTVGFWLTREARYREALARQEERKTLKSDIGWLQKLPLSDMCKFGWIRKFADKGEQVAECLRFFGVANIEAWEIKYEHPIAAFRASKQLDKFRGSIAAWLRQSERSASEIICQPFDKEKFKETLNEIRTLTKENNPAIFVPELRKLCAKVGVAVVLEPVPRRCPVSDATRWLGSDKALLVLSNRYKVNDQFWFSFFHEAGHLLLLGGDLVGNVTVKATK